MSDLTQWIYKRSHAITSGTELTDYQVKIRVYRTEGTSTGDTVYLGSKCLADYGDIRFVASDDTTELSYWMETNAGSYADFWVKVPSIVSDSSIYIYYGNSSATTTSNGDTTFEFFDDFTGTSLDTSKWALSGSGSATVSSGILTLTTNVAGYTRLLNTSATYGNNIIMEARLQTNAAGNNTYRYQDISLSNAAFNKSLISQLAINGANSRYLNADAVGSPAYSTLDMSPTWVASTYKILTLKRHSTAEWQQDRANTQTLATHYPTDNLSPLFVVYSYNTSYYSTILADWVLVRQYTTTEPTHGSWTTEQEITSYPLRITITPTSGTDPLSVAYNLSINEALDNFILNFGDGQEYTGDDITSFATTHTYNTPGTYTVWAEGYNEFATHVFYEIPYGVTVSAPSVVASFTTSQSYNTITFTNTSTGNINECYWTFGDGRSSYEESPTHTYWSPATYNVTLYASNQYQYDTYTTTVTITQVLTPPEVYFTPNNLNVISPTLPYTVNFTNLSTPAFGCTYNWLIDGTSYTTQNASHSFATYGMYDVGLTVTNALGSSTRSYTDAIRITRKGKTFYEVINYADTPATFHVEVFNEVATSADTVIQAHIFDESINFVQDEIPDEPGLDEWGMRHFYSSINEWGHRIISAVTDWGNRILYNGSTLDNSPVTLFKAQEFREDLILSDEWQFGTT
jgi:PKD repeat protein